MKKNISSDNLFPYSEGGITIAILKIILWILLAVLMLLLLVCLLNVKIKVYNKNGYGYKLTVGGIRIKPEWFMGRKDGHKKPGKDKESEKSKKKKKQPAMDAGNTGASKKKKSLGSVINIITRVAVTAKDVLPKGVRIKLKYLHINVGGTDAAEAAMNYGKVQALLHGVFALFEDYKGFLYGFRAKRKNVVINADFFSEKTSAEFEMSISFFLWQLLFSGIRIGISAIGAIIDSEEE